MCKARAIGKQYRTMYYMYVVHTVTLAERLGVGPEGGRGTPDFGKSVNPISQRIVIMSKHISLAPQFFWHFGGPVNATYL